MKKVTYAGLAIGLAVLVLLLAWRGVGDVAAILAGSGWNLLLLPLAWLPVFLMFARSWQVLFEPGAAPSFQTIFGATWIGRSVNNLLPVAQLGGEVVRARVLALWGTDGVDAAATVLVDKTVQALAALSFGVFGVVLLFALSLAGASAVDLALPVLGGLVLVAAGVAGFVAVQRAGLFGFAARAASTLGKGDFWEGLVDRADDVDNRVRAVYGRPSRVVRGYAWRMTGLFVQAGEVWLAAYLLGHPIGIVEALMIKALASAISDAAFVVPNGYGVQEGAYVVLGGLMGLAPEFMLALSLATRLRELVFDVPGLVLWQHAEGRRFFRRRMQGVG